jgi:hypothetical protein
MSIVAQKRTINIIIVLKSNLKKEKDIKEFRDKLQTLKGILTKIADKNEPSKSQKDNWITIKQYDDVIDKLNIKVDKILKDKNFNATNLNSIQYLIILKFYKQINLRNDFADLKIITSRAFEKLKNKTKYNYIIITKKKNKITILKIMLNHFKTKNIFKTKNYTIVDTNLLNLVTQYLSVRPKSQWFLVNQKNKSLTKENGMFSTYFFRMTRKLFDGKSIGTSLLRHIVITDKLVCCNNYKTKKERRDIADTMLHSLDSQSDYVKILKPST